MNSLKEKLKKGESIVGVMVALIDRPQIATIMKSAGYDFFIIDNEHGPFDYGKMAGILMVAKEAGMPALVRIPEPRREVILKCMEMGAKGILMPNTETVEQARLLVECSKYAPLGNRGVALIREHTSFQKPANVVEYMKQANDETLLMVQIESPVGVKNLSDIMDVEGIDVAFVGPADLSQSLGIMGQMDNPIFLEAMEKIISIAQEKGKFSGVHLMDSAPLKKWKSKGMTCNMLSSDVNLILKAAKDSLEDFRS